ncbi:hypothetical protein EVAR_44725_1 [Eumeta japonica]|uniref:Uncharacterized protein n=1 Tax=Eumeta variegata TaxID=151549 RepID=A0A4C1XF18_EUMVA|nr:hypothetical protein EVAR_44725_1 [Eumeta japonica]
MAASYYIHENGSARPVVTGTVAHSPLYHLSPFIDVPPSDILSLPKRLATHWRLLRDSGPDQHLSNAEDKGQLPQPTIKRLGEGMPQQTYNSHWAGTYAEHVVYFIKKKRIKGKGVTDKNNMETRSGSGQTSGGSGRVEVTPLLSAPPKRIPPAEEQATYLKIVCGTR